MDEDRKAGPDGGRHDLTDVDEDLARATLARPLPRSLRRRLDRCADEYLGERGLASGSRRTSRGVLLPWALTVVLFAVAVAGWWPRLVDPQTSVAAFAAAQWRARLARERMIESGHRIGHWPWQAEAAVARGDVVWDFERQRGFLLLRGLAPNDPSQSRYQLWIFDAGRDERYPVDGGLFDVPRGRDDVVVPVAPAVRIARPAAFAVTVEKPDGAVVSDRAQVVAFAAADR